LLSVLALAGILLPGLATADEAAKKAASSKPPWQRTLQGEDAKKAAEQANKLDQLEEAGQLAEALEVAEALVELRRKVQGADHWQTVNVHVDVEVLRRVLRQGEQAQKDLTRAYVLHRQAEKLRSRGRFREAQPLLEQAVALCRKLLGEDHLYTADGYHGLATVLNDLGHHAQAEEIHRKALAIRLKELGADHPDTAGSYNNLAYSQSQQGKYAQAEESLRKALTIKRKVLGEEHPDTAHGYHSLASNQSAQGKFV
jgi:tetratricopeptide (TPR) repeat protein